MSSTVFISNPETSSHVGGARILIDQVTKHYPGQKKPAVDGVTLEIPAGKIVMFVGPSGCGKTTTLKMINRLIEPSEGRIFLGDDDVSSINGDRLRRRIGYVIQAGGLFPHMTVATNIGMVPKMLGWDKQRIAAKVDELLRLVSLDPDTYRNRYPKQLSGGQQQRVGVARALAADPPVLLMDEPFGAVDPITRQRLQDELLSIQRELQKTIIIVTHDFDEAVKLGDWIVVFGEGAEIVQYDTPERILISPANEFVEGFIGSGAGLKQLSLTRVEDIELLDAVTVRPGCSAQSVLQQMNNLNQDHAVVLDDQDRPIQWLSRLQLSRLVTVQSTVDPKLPIVTCFSTVNDALDNMLVLGTGATLVTGARGNFIGVIDVETVMRVMNAARKKITGTRERAAPVGLNTGSLNIQPVQVSNQ